MNSREQAENFENEYLSRYACKSAESRGRETEIEECAIRTVFQRDRDRITHSKSFRRLMHKTQVFIAPEGDHYRTRLTHTLEVAQIARTISRALRLNEDLTEAIALGHDLGHTPFGHTGEDALDRLLPGGFRHNEQSVRIIRCIENNGNGLNLTREVIDGIENHRTEGKPSTLEGRVVQLSDKIGYINHDIDDAIRAGALNPGDLPRYGVELLGETSADRINYLINSIVRTSLGKERVDMEGDAAAALAELRTYMFDTVYQSQLLSRERAKIKSMFEHLFLYFLEKPAELPSDFYRMIEAGESPQRAVCDHIACMTDRYALKTFTNLIMPLSWI